MAVSDAIHCVSTSCFFWKRLYYRKNQLYYTAANTHAKEIKDSLLQEKIRRLISVSQAGYDSKILQHTALLNGIEERVTTLNDLHEVLKIIQTLPLIEKDQNNNLPATKPLERFIKNIDRTLKTADTLTNK